MGFFVVDAMTSLSFPRPNDWKDGRGVAEEGRPGCHAKRARVQRKTDPKTLDGKGN